MRRPGQLEAWKAISPCLRTIGSRSGDLARSSTKGVPRHQRWSRPFIGLEPFLKRMWTGARANACATITTRAKTS